MGSRGGREQHQDGSCLKTKLHNRNNLLISFNTQVSESMAAIPIKRYLCPR